MLLLITALFMEKNIIFTSKSEGAATLCALFLVNIISPFVYKRHLILNCDSEMVQDMVFSFPMPLVASIKKPNNFSTILTNFIDNTMFHFEGFK